MNDKELAIKVAEKLGDLINGNEISYGNFNILFDNPYFVESYMDKYLHDKAAQILFSEGMAGKITEHLYKYCRKDGQSYEVSMATIKNWWQSKSNNGTMTSQKILTLWLEMESE